MTLSSPSPASLPDTLYFPISGNPIGFNHFAAAEWLLRGSAGLERVLFLLSNGRHPDPTKADAEVGPRQRLRLCELSLEGLGDPAGSLLARRAEGEGERLRLAPERAALSTVEFTFDRAVRTAELIPLLRAGRGEAADSAAPPLPWFAGSDLVRRMADPRIFSDADLALLSAHCHYHVLDREGENLAEALASLRDGRGIALSCTVYSPQALPAWLAPFLALSSTAIRQAAEAGDPLAGMLPARAAAMIEREGFYQAGRIGARLVAPDGAELGTRSTWALSIEALRARLEEEAGALAAVLESRREQARPHSLALLETTTGGLLTAALAGRSGASRYFRQARFAYDAHAKTSLVGGPLPGSSAVTPEAVAALANAMRQAAQTDYALAESGMAGPPDGTRRSLKNGLCWFATAGPAGTRSEPLQLNPFLTRREHQLRFSLHALALLRRTLAEEA